MYSEDNIILKPKERLRIIIKNADIELSESVPLRRYFRSASELYRMASVYQQEGNLEQALILFTRYVTMLLERVPKHPDYKTIGKDERNNYQKNIKIALDLAEKDKKILTSKFETEAEKLKQDIEDTRRLAEIERLEQEENNPNNVSNVENFNESNYDSNSNDFDPFIVDTSITPFPELGGEGASTILKPQVPPRVSKPAVSAGGVPNTIPSFDRSTKPVGYSGLRDIVIPSNLPMLFLKLAEKNTERNVETCGILSGKLSQNKFLITHLVLPKQSGTPDSCLTEREEEVFDFQDKHELITVGWIHTHPTQTAFLSSVDLHSHCSYQLMLPEAIAIVCSPKFNDVGVFMLTPDHGLREISSCRQVGFHPHSQEPPLFEVCQHAQFSNRFSASVVDLR